MRRLVLVLLLALAACQAKDPAPTPTAATAPVPAPRHVDPEPVATADNQAAVAELRRAITEDYSHYGLRDIKWDEVFAKDGDALATATSPKAFAQAASVILTQAQDIHIHLEVDGEKTQYFTFAPPANFNFDLKLLKKILPGLTGDRCAGSVMLEGGVGYLIIPAWSAACADSIKQQVATFDRAATKGMIIDVRANGGGDDRIASWVAGCFATQPVAYSRLIRRDKGHLSSPQERMLEANPACPHFNGRTAVLIGPGVMSSSEAFVLMMRATGAKLVGAPTYGASGNPQPHKLGNGVTVFLPSWRETQLDGTPIEGRGVPPDIAVTFDAASGDDAVLAKAITLVRP